MHQRIKHYFLASYFYSVKIYLFASTFLCTVQFYKKNIITLRITGDGAGWNTLQMQLLIDGGLLCSQRTSVTEHPQLSHKIYSCASQLLN